MNTTAIDAYLQSDREFVLSLTTVKFNERVGKVARLVYDKFSARNPREAQKMIDYIFDNYVPFRLHDRWT